MFPFEIQIQSHLHIILFWGGVGLCPLEKLEKQAVNTTQTPHLVKLTW